MAEDGWAGAAADRASVVDQVIGIASVWVSLQS